MILDSSILYRFSGLIIAITKIISRWNQDLIIAVVALLTRTESIFRALFVRKIGLRHKKPFI